MGSQFVPPAFERGLIAYTRERYGSVLSRIADTGELPEDEIVAAITGFKSGRDGGVDETGELEA